VEWLAQETRLEDVARMASVAITLRNGERIRLLHALPFLSVHLACLAVFFVPFSWAWVAVAVELYAVRMFFVTAGYHRYFSHRSFKTSRIFQFILACLAMSSAQKGVLWWAAHHRWHHRYSDTDEDRHSPIRFGFWWSHVGWIISDTYDRTELQLIRDFAKYPELRFLDRFHLIPPVTFAVVLFLIGSWTGLVWGFFVSTVLLWHGSFTINSLAHLFGRRRYKTTDTSRNNWWLALLTLGEGWHNNHHYYMSSVRQGFFWWEVDFTYYGLKILSWMRIVWDLRVPPPHLLEPNAA
jgi:stearoyl-CoA desaturase (delta-9 desaturase)